MQKRVAIAMLLALCAMAPLAQAQASLTDIDILQIVFPGASPAPAEDFAYAIDPPAVPEPGSVYRVKETKPFDGKLLVVIEAHGPVHASGYHNHLFGVIDVDTRAAAGEWLRFSADRAEYYLGVRDGVPGVLYVGQKTYQGHDTFSGGKWSYQDGAWRMDWPQGGFDAFWSGLKAEIAYDPPGSVRLFRRQGDAWAPDGMDEPFAR